MQHDESINPAEPSATRALHAEGADGVLLPVPTAWPMVLALGITLMIAGHGHALGDQPARRCAGCAVHRGMVLRSAAARASLRRSRFEPGVNSKSQAHAPRRQNCQSTLSIAK